MDGNKITFASPCCMEYDQIAVSEAKHFRKMSVAFKKNALSFMRQAMSCHPNSRDPNFE